MVVSDKAVVHESVTIGENTKIEPGVVIYKGCRIGRDCIVGANTVMRPNTCIGDNTICGPLSMYEGDIGVGDNTTIGAQAHITRGMRIGNDVFVGPCVLSTNTKKITAGRHGTSQDKIRADILPPNIEDMVRIGARVTIMPGITIGHHSLIAAGCMITRDILPNSFVIGGKDQIGRMV